MATSMNFSHGTDVEVSLLERTVASAEEAHREAVANTSTEFCFLELPIVNSITNLYTRFFSYQGKYYVFLNDASFVSLILERSDLG